MPAWPPDGQADHGDLPRPAAAVAILEAASTRALVRPGDTIEFYTRFNLVPPPGRPDAYVEATWILKRDAEAWGNRVPRRPSRSPGSGCSLRRSPSRGGRSGALYGRAPHQDRERSGQRPLAVLGSLALNLGVKTLPLPPLVGEYRGAGPLLL